MMMRQPFTSPSWTYYYRSALLIAALVPTSTLSLCTEADRLACQDSSNAPNINVYNEVFGENSQCIDSSAGERCYVVACELQLSPPPELFINVAGAWYSCAESNIIRPNIMADIELECPDFATICRTSSIAPSLYPTINPTIQPSIDPTQSPTTHPSINPSYGPSEGPSSIPSSYSSLDPTLNPTEFPSENPSTISLSAGPSILSSEEPSKFPTIMPSIASSNSAAFSSDLPSLLPSTHPSSSTTSTNATGALDDSDQSSLTPSVEESESQQPSIIPSSSPSSFPSPSAVVSDGVYTPSKNKQPRGIFFPSLVTCFFLLFLAPNELVLVFF